MLSWREHPGACFDIVRKRLQVTGGTTRSAGVDYLLYALLDAVIDSYFPVLEQLGEVLRRSRRSRRGRLRSRR